MSEFHVGQTVCVKRILTDLPDNEDGSAAARIGQTGRIKYIHNEPYWGRDNHVVLFEDGRDLCYAATELEAAP